MFEHLKDRRRVVVTGPQRSGTTICARMIAHDTGHHYVDEEVFGVHDRAAFEGVARAGIKVVIQAPAMCRHAHELPSDALIVLMRRPLTEIHASQKRVDWQFAAIELERYGLTEGDPAAVKYEFWDREQAARIADKLEVRYADLASHPLWVDPQARAAFVARQWR